MCLFDGAFVTGSRAGSRRFDIDRMDESSAPVRRTRVRFTLVDDRLLALRLCSGDDSALREILDRHGALVLGLARRVTGSRAMAEDVMQEVFAELWARPGRYDSQRGTLRAYLGILTHRTAVDAVRSAVRRQAREERAERPWAVPVDPTDMATSQEMVRQAIERLPNEQRRAVELTFWQGMTNHEVAQALGVPEGTVKSRLRLAEAKLRAWLEPLAMEAV